ncbi:MAG: PqqD family protein [Thermoplasmata archaeon]|nr:PqqD family protein [Thermoplasmata archaeon]RLF43952.1 MAG: PqqD family protein [Thermoplasmata archaeon]
MKKRHEPSLDEILQLKPVRGNFKWERGEDGNIILTVPKFKSNIGKWLCKALGKKETFIAHLDRIGSAVWEQCDGKTTVERILKTLKEKFPDEKDLDQRLVYYLFKLKELGYLSI